MANDFGLNDLLRQIDKTKSIVETAVAAAVGQVTIDIANDAKINHSFTNRTGNLENSIQPLPVKVNGNIIEGGVNAGMDYSGFVEFGTSKSAPYPYLTPAVESNRGNLTNTVAEAVNRAEQVMKVR